MATSVRSRSRKILAVFALSVASALTLATPAFAATQVAPSSGPATGGTTVTIPAATLGFTQVAQGEDMGYGLSGDGWVYAWGQNANDELGDGGSATSATPVRVLPGAIPAGVTITQVAAGWNSGYALGSNGRLYSWGANFRGQLGDGTTTAENEPVEVNLTGLGAGVRLTQIAAGGFNGYALASDGTVYSWGLGGDGELGNGGNSDSTTPVAVDTSVLPVGTTFTQIAVGQVTAFGLASNGHVYSWGSDVVGALGTGGTGDVNVPTPISAGAIPPTVAITQVAGGQEGGYALGDDGLAYAWGSNQFGDLGDGSNTDSNVAVRVIGGDIPAGVKFTQLAAGSSSAYGLGTDGHVYSWGNGGNGQLGNGSSSSSTSPVLVSTGEVQTGVAITRISGGYHSAIALGNDARIYGWGDNGGDLGDGTTTQRSTPVLGANAKISAVTFGGVAGTAIVDPPGVTTVVTPAHAVGSVTIVVDGTIDGGAAAGVATSRALPNTFTFLPTLAVTGAEMPWWLLAVGCGAITVGAVALARKRVPRWHGTD